MTRLLATTALAAFIVQGAVGAASAADTKANKDTTANQSTTQTASNLPQEIKQELKSDGFTDVKVMPGSFVVSAKDKRGNPVTMFIGPHSYTMVKAIDTDRTTGSAADDQDQSSDNK